MSTPMMKSINIPTPTITSISPPPPSPPPSPPPDEEVSTINGNYALYIIVLRFSKGSSHT